MLIRIAVLVGIVLAGVEIGARLLAATLIPGEIAAALERHAMLLGSGPVDRVQLRERGPLEANEVVHPYLGFAILPDEHAQPDTLQDFGFPQWAANQKPVPLSRVRDPDAFVVGVFGGSVAADFVRAGGPERLLAQLPEYAGERPVVVSAAQRGFKQPQQLLSLAYLLTLGVDFDVVLLLDGFNEVALAPTENATTGVHPVFPRRWDWRIANLGAINRASRRTIGEIAYRGRRRRDVAIDLRASPLRHSGLVRIAWWAWDRREEAAIARLRVKLAESSRRDLDYAAAGPRWPRAGDDALLEDLTSVWSNASLAMRDLCQGRGIRFFHGLQPNQYVPGAKPMDAPERRIAIDPDGIYVAPVPAGYVKLREAGTRLVAAGVPFFDLTMAFADVEERLYVDECCHVSARGSEILADRWAAAIRADALATHDTGS